jgi:hypothetical protein
MKKYLVFFLFLLNSILFSQTYFDLKVGTSVNYGLGHYPFVEFEEHGHSPQGYPYLSYNSNAKVAYASPYINASVAFQRSASFEWQMGFSYLQYRQGISYADQTIIGNVTKPYPYTKIISFATGNMVYNTFRYEFAPTIKGKHIKASFGILNIEYNIVKANNLKGTKNEYTVIPDSKKPYFHQYSGYLEGFSDSLVTLQNSENIQPTYNFNPWLYASFSFGLEREFKIKEHSYLLGGKVSSAFHKNYYQQKDMANYYQFIVYIGTRLSGKKAKVDPKSPGS